MGLWVKGFHLKEVCIWWWLWRREGLVGIMRPILNSEGAKQGAVMAFAPHEQSCDRIMKDWRT